MTKLKQLRREVILRRYFGNQALKRRWLIMVLMIFGAMIILYAIPITNWLDKRFDKSISSRFGEFWKSSIIIEKETVIVYLGLFLIAYSAVRLLNFKFPGIFRAVLVLLGAAMVVYLSSAVAQALIMTMQKLSTLAGFSLNTINEPDITNALFWLGVAFGVFGSVLLAFAILRPMPSDNKVDRWLKESIDRLWQESLKKLRILEEDIITEQNKQLRVVFPSFYLLDRQESPASRRTKVGKFFRMLIDSVKVWLLLDDELDSEELEIGREDWKIHEGRDHVLRFTEYVVIFVHLTREFMGYFECDYNFLRDKVLVERFGHHFYEDIVAVWMEEEARSRNLLQGTKVTKFQSLKIWLRGSQNIEREAPQILFIPRKLLDRLIWRSQKYKILESQMDVVVKNLNAMLDNEKQRRSQTM